jgi:hypothetical protein
MYAHFTLGTLSNNAISSTHYYIRGFTPQNLAFNGGVFVDVALYGSSYYWLVGLLNTPSYTTVNYIIRSNPSGIAIRDNVANTNAVLYYTLYDSTTTGYVLYKENIDLKFNYTNQVKASINKN